jgi:hypothetical protein
MGESGHPEQGLQQSQQMRRRRLDFHFWESFYLAAEISFRVS